MPNKDTLLYSNLFQVIGHHPFPGVSPGQPRRSSQSSRPRSRHRGPVTSDARGIPGRAEEVRAAGGPTSLSSSPRWPSARIPVFKFALCCAKRASRRITYGAISFDRGTGSRPGLWSGSGGRPGSGSRYNSPARGSSSPGDPRGFGTSSDEKGTPYLSPGDCLFFFR